jgi:hypothetical protein
MVYYDTIHRLFNCTKIPEDLWQVM